MPDLVAADVIVTVEKQVKFQSGQQKRQAVKLVFGDGAKTYPSGGVPLPAAVSFGLVKQLEFLSLYDSNDGGGIMWKYDRENKKLRGWIQGVTLSAAGGATADDYPLDTAADPLATGTSMMFITTTAAGTKYLGTLKELNAGVAAPTSQTLYAEAVGW